MRHRIGRYYYLQTPNAKPLPLAQNPGLVLVAGSGQDNDSLDR
jgi:hypothetical protein